MIEEQPPRAVLVRFHAHRAKRAIAGHAVASVRQLQIVQMWVVGAPPVRTRHVEDRLARPVGCGRRGCARNFRAFVEHPHGQLAAVHRRAAHHRSQREPPFDARVDGQPFDARFRNRFQPHALPDAALRGVPDAPALQPLLAAQLHARVARVPHAYGQLVLAGDQRIRDVERERQVAAYVLAYAHPVHIACACVVHGFEVHNEAPTALHVHAVRHGERPSVPQKLVRLQLPLRARQGRFRRERHEDAPVPGVRRGGIAPGLRGAVGVDDGVVPPAVEQLEPRPRELRMRMQPRTALACGRLLAPRRGQRPQLRLLRLARSARDDALDVQHGRLSFLVFEAP